MKRIITALIFFLPVVATAAEPMLVVEFEGYVTKNTFTCKEAGFGCPSSDHFGAPDWDGSMVDDPLYNRITGTIYIAYTRPPVTLQGPPYHQSFNAATNSFGPENFVTGLVTVGGATFDLDRDYKGTFTSIREIGNVENFSMYQIEGQRASFVVAPTSRSGREYKTYREGVKTSHLKYYAETSLRLTLDVFELIRSRLWGPMSETSLPGFKWRNSGFGADTRSHIRLFNHRYEMRDGSEKNQQYTTRVYFELLSLKVESINGKFPESGDPEKEKADQVPNRPELSID